MTETTTAPAALQSDRAALVAGYLDDPRDEARRNVLADWLREHGEAALGDRLAKASTPWDGWDFAAGKNTYRAVRNGGLVLAFLGGPRALTRFRFQVAAALAAVQSPRETARTLDAQYLTECLARRIPGSNTREQRSDLLDMSGGVVANAYKYAAYSTVALGAVAKTRGGWLVGLALDRNRCNGRHVSLPLGGLSRSAREYKRDDHAFYLRLFAERLSAPEELRQKILALPVGRLS